MSLSESWPLHILTLFLSQYIALALRYLGPNPNPCPNPSHRGWPGILYRPSSFPDIFVRLWCKEGWWVVLPRCWIPIQYWRRCNKFTRSVIAVILCATLVNGRRFPSKAQGPGEASDFFWSWWPIKLLPANARTTGSSPRHRGSPTQKASRRCNRCTFGPSL